VYVAVVVVGELLRFRLWRGPKERFPARVTDFEAFHTNVANIGVTTGQDHRVFFVQIKLIDADYTMQVHIEIHLSLF
jgi:hypothetical protein